VSIESRLKKLEGFREPNRCPACNDKIVFIEEHDDGTETYPAGRPCPEYRGKADPVSGLVRFLVILCATESCPACEPRRTPRGEGVVVNASM
jgi:hypothetical protein